MSPYFLSSYIHFIQYCAHILLVSPCSSGSGQLIRRISGMEFWVDADNFHKRCRSCALANEIIAFLTKLCMYNTMSITGSNVSNMLCEFNLNMSDIINGSTSNLMKIAYTGFNALPDELWKCDMILELTDCIYGFSNCGFKL